MVRFVEHISAITFLVAGLLTLPVRLLLNRETREVVNCNCTSVERTDNRK